MVNMPRLGTITHHQSHCKIPSQNKNNLFHTHTYIQSTHIQVSVHVVAPA